MPININILYYIPSNKSLEDFALMFGENSTKYAFSYNWFDSVDKLNSTKLPNIECFHNSLQNKDCTLKEYEKVQNY